MVGSEAGVQAPQHPQGPRLPHESGRFLQGPGCPLGTRGQAPAHGIAATLQWLLPSSPPDSHGDRPLHHWQVRPRTASQSGHCTPPPLHPLGGQGGLQDGAVRGGPSWHPQFRLPWGVILGCSVGAGQTTPERPHVFERVDLCTQSPPRAAAMESPKQSPGLEVIAPPPSPQESPGTSLQQVPQATHPAR